MVMFSRAILLCQSEEIVTRLSSLISAEDTGAAVEVFRDTEEVLVELTNKQPGKYIVFFECGQDSAAHLIRFVRFVREKGGEIRLVTVVVGGVCSGHLDIIKSGADDFIVFPFPDDVQFSILYKALSKFKSDNRRGDSEQSGKQNSSPQMIRSADSSDAAFEALSETLSEGILRADLDGKIIYCNTKLSELTGFSKNELTGQTLFNTLVPPNNRTAIHARYQNRKKGIAEEYELEVLKRNGETFWAHLSSKPYKDVRGEIVGVVAALNDITNVRSSTEESNYRRLFLRQVIDTSPNIIYSVNAEGRFSLVNQAFSDLVGIPIKNLVGKEIAHLAENPGSTVDSAKILDIFSHHKAVTSKLQLTRDNVQYSVKMVRKELVLPTGKDRQVLNIGTFEKSEETNEDVHDLHNALQKISAEAEVALLRRRPEEMELGLEKVIAYSSIASASAEKTSPLPTLVEQRKRVLVIDDEEQIVELLSNLLQVSGFIVYGFTSGADAMSWAAEHGGEIDAAILDLKMQSLNGKDCLTALKKICPEAPVVILSGFVEPNVEAALLKQGAAKFFHKPLRYAQLVACLRDLLGISEAEPAGTEAVQ